MKQSIGQILGFECHCENGSSYSRARLSIFGERDERSLRGSVKRKLKKLNGKIQPEYGLGYMQGKGAA
jgi:hypothetical protein